MGGWVGWLVGLELFRDPQDSIEREPILLGRDKNGSKNWRSNFVSIVLREPELELFFPQTPKRLHNKEEELWKLAVQ